ncbi:MAG: hemolysin family protein [SAR202 cluster bacterium]|nr:hemolysin family protein [SAR202 cluster bacterium]
MDIPYLYIILVLISLGFSAFFSSAESAFLSLQNTPRLQHLVNSGSSKALRVQKMLDHPERLLATILLGNNLVNILFASLITMIVMNFMKDEVVGVIVSTALGTGILLLFGEVIPKAFAVRNSEKVAFFYALPLKIFEFTFYPIIQIIQFISRKILNQNNEEKETPSITENEIRTLIDIGESEGTFEPEKVELLENVFKFGDRQAREIMTPRNEIVFVEQNSSLNKFLKIYSDNSHSRFPVYQNETENITGIISSKDILKSISTNKLTSEISISNTLLRPAIFSPETKKISELFTDMRMSGNQISLIVDEFGGIAGLITLKNLLTELAGQVGEEGEAPEEEFEAINKFTFKVDGGMDINEAKEAFEIDLPDGNYETVAGFVLEHLGHIPSTGEQFEYKGIKIQIIEMQEFKVQSIRLTKPS